MRFVNRPVSRHRCGVRDRGRSSLYRRLVLLLGSTTRRRVAPASPAPAPFPISAREQQLIAAKRRLMASMRHVVGRVDDRISSRRARPGSAGRFAPCAAACGEATRDHSLDATLVITEFSYYRGVLHAAGSVTAAEPLAGVGVILPGGRYQRATTAATPAGVCLIFDFEVAIGGAGAAVQTVLAIEYAIAGVVAVDDLPGRALADDPVSVLTRRFHEQVGAMTEPRVLEIGARARSGNTHRGWLPQDATYVGCDILPGENVDVVGDAHRLSEVVAPRSFDALYSVSTLEHLAMPWLAALEMNRVLTTGAVMFHATHQTWPVHDAPWDFYRFSEYAWVTLFNRFSGFEIIATAAGEPGKVIANVVHPATSGLDLQPAFLSSAVLARKVGETDLSWAADAAAVVRDAYPA